VTRSSLRQLRRRRERALAALPQRFRLDDVPDPGQHPLVEQDLADRAVDGTRPAQVRRGVEAAVEQVGPEPELRTPARELDPACDDEISRRCAQDVAAAALVYERALEAGIGREWDVAP